MRASETFQTVTLELFTVCTRPYDEGLLLLIVGQERSSLNLWRLLPILFLIFLPVLYLPLLPFKIKFLLKTSVPQVFQTILHLQFCPSHFLLEFKFIFCLAAFLNLRMTPSVGVIPSLCLNTGGLHEFELVVVYA